jgi:hypothetical protein
VALPAAVMGCGGSGGSSQAPTSTSTRLAPASTTAPPGIAFYTDAAAAQGPYRPENIRDMIFLAIDEATPSAAPAC